MAVLDSLIIAVLWFFLGFTGIHLFVAGRRTEGFLWLGSGGVFGFGYLGDLGRLHLLIREYRGDPRAFARQAPSKKSDDATPEQEVGPPLSLGLAFYQFVLANWYWFIASLAVRVILFTANIIELSEAASGMLYTVIGSLVASCVIALLHYTDMRACNVRGLFGACCGLATTLYALKTSGITGDASTQGPIIAGIVVSRLSSRWSKRKNAHKDIITPKMTLLAVGLVILGTGVVAYAAYNAALNFQVPIPGGNGETLSARDIMRESGTNNIFRLYDFAISDPYFVSDLIASMTGEMTTNMSLKLLQIPTSERETITKQRVSRAFRKQSLRVHPDKYDGPHEEAMRLQVELGRARDKLMTVASDDAGEENPSIEEIRRR